MDDFAINETGENPSPSYDVSTSPSTIPEKSCHHGAESGAQRLQKNGKTLEGLLDEVAEFDNIASWDGVAGIPHRQ